MFEIAIHDMTCGHCASVIAKAVREIDAAARFEIDLAARKVTIAAAGPPDEFVAAIAEAGYTPVVARQAGSP